jgi:preprotein translocase subunit YajC
MSKRWLIIGLIIAALALVVGGCTYGTTATTATDGTATTGNSTTSTIYMVVFLVLIFGLFWFTMVRPQRKRQKEHDNMMKALQKGDRVITAGGIYGIIDTMDEDSIVIKVESGATMRVAKGSVVVIRTK